MVDEHWIRQVQGALDTLRNGNQSVAGDLAALALGRHRDLAMHLLRQDYRRLQGHDTDSIINNAWIQLIAALHKEPPATIAALLGLACQIIRHDLIDMVRRESARQRCFPALAESQAPEPGTTTLDPVELASWAEFHEEVGNLPDDQRQIFELHFYQGMKQTAIAQLLDLPPRQVSRLWIRATRALAPWVQDGYLD